MAKFSTTITFSNSDQVTSDKLNEIITGLSFAADAVVGTTLAVVGGQIKVGVITSAEMGPLSIASGSIQDGAVTTAKIALGAVTTGELATASVTAGKIALGNINFSHLSTATVATKAQMEFATASTLVSADKAKYSQSAVKAYAEIGLSGTGRPIYDNSYGVASVTRLTSTTTVVTLAAQMDSANYVVAANIGYNAGTPAAGSAVPYNKLSTSFRVLHPAETTGLTINVSVFGKLNA